MQRRGNASSLHSTIKPSHDQTIILMNPPKHFFKFFRWFCAPEYFEELEGDLEENYQQNRRLHGEKYARKIYRKEVLMLFRPSVMKKLNLRINNNYSSALFKNYLKISLRNLYRHRLFSFINIFGLAVSMSVGLLIIAMVADLMKFDEFHQKKDRIFRVNSHIQYGHYQSNESATCVLPLAEKLKAEYAEVEEIVRIKKNFGAEAEANGKMLPLQGYFSDPSFFQVFSFEWLEGDPNTALNEPFSMVITHRAAEKLFDQQDPMGQTVNMGNMGDFRITGVLKDIPIYSHLQFEVLGSMASVAALEQQNKIRPSLNKWDEFWTNYVYVLLKSEKSTESLEEGLSRISQEKYVMYENLKADFELQALLKIVPGPDISTQIGPKMPYLPIFILSGLAFLILLSAAFNYTNLSIARSLRRTTEVGVRKVVGANRRQVFTQFITETVVISVFALLVGSCLFYLIRPEFLSTISLSNTKLFELTISPGLVTVFLCYAILAGLLSGWFPALFLSRMRPVDVLKSISSFTIFRGLGFRKVLTVFQFSLSLIFILAVSIIYRQYQFSLNHDMGFEEENILNIALQGNDPQVLAPSLKQLPEISHISMSSLIPAMGSNNRSWLKHENINDSLAMYQMYVDPNYIENLGLIMLAGENFPVDVSTKEERYLIVNEHFIGTMGWENPLDALGQWVELGGKQLNIIGVVKDFHYNHLEEPIENFCFRYHPNRFNYLNVKLSSSDIKESMAKIEEVWKSIDTKHTLQAQFFEEQLDEAYGFYTHIIKIFGFIAVLTISIASMGLLGMSVFTVETKTKEIGIRKVLGASELRLVYLLSKGFVKLLCIAAIIAVPLAYIFFDQVLLSLYAYRISIGFPELSLGVILVFILGITIIASQTFRAARMNPAETLRSE